MGWAVGVSTWFIRHAEPRSDEWFLCDQPERPPDEFTAVHLLCHGCFVAVGAARLLTGSDWPPVRDDERGTTAVRVR